MALTITDTLITSDKTGVRAEFRPHAAADGDGAWVMFYSDEHGNSPDPAYCGRLFDRGQAISAMTIEEAKASPKPDLAATPPHKYIPAGPLEQAPPGGFREVAIRLDALEDVLEGVKIGAYDEKIVAWLAGLDDTTCRTVASLFWRCRQAGPC